MQLTRTSVAKRIFLISRCFASVLAELLFSFATRETLLSCFWNQLLPQ